ncbi:N-acetyl-gamma-glutamyl-phosphate reductase [Salsipaludibacter albus]|uniref:N-acetyl-gamma-glutamyl-phosphate reductase n=1 Tax=Salsipaludibacter albus TaxID=2849650 RepID=UPI001EE4206C|nr:N-acetyl-gamma-glutamyl-phosphate reductase [Salsipaludibacter albus]
MARVGIVGASGYGGAELVRLLDGHPDLEVETLAAHSGAGTPVADLFPNLQGRGRFDAIDVDALGRLDLVFVATPDGPALDLVPDLVAAGTRVVDLSAAHRLPAEDYATFYGQAHPRPDDTPAVYGLTEFARDRVADATVVANPGCYVTTALLSLVPVASLLDLSTLVVDGKSGTSGAGRGVSDRMHVSHVTASITAYGVPGHRHTGEIEVHLGLLGEVDRPTITFTPHLVPMVRGLLTTSVARLADGVMGDDLRDALETRYADEPFVTVLPAGTQPVTKAVAGSNSAQVAVEVDDRTGRATLTSVTDNLVKGAAGQAVQNANMMLGLDERAGLPTVGTYP